MEASFQQPFSQTCALTLVTRIFWWRCACGKHPFPSRTRRLRRKRPMVLHWRRCGRAGGRQIKKRTTDEDLMNIQLVLPVIRDFKQGLRFLMTDKISVSNKDCTLKTAYMYNLCSYCKCTSERSSSVATASHIQA